MACCWIGTKPLPKPMLTDLQSNESILQRKFTETQIEIQQTVPTRKPFSKRDLWNICRVFPQINKFYKRLTHWGRVTHICVGNLIIIGSDNGLSPDRRQAIIWTNAGILLIWPLGTNFREILNGIQTFSFKKMHLKMSSAKWHQFVSASMG